MYDNLGLWKHRKITTTTQEEIDLAKRIDYVVVDNSIYDNIYFGPGWMWDEGAWWYAAQISALSVNDNCVDFIIKPGELGVNAIIQTKPESNYYKIINNSITVDDIIIEVGGEILWRASEDGFPDTQRGPEWVTEILNKVVGTEDIEDAEIIN